MLGSISKVRPCGHHHYYKYAHCPLRQDLLAVCKNDSFRHDLTEGCWGPFGLNQFTNDVKSWNSYGVFYNPKMKKWIASVPNLKNLFFLFWAEVSDNGKDARPNNAHCDFEFQNMTWNDFKNLFPTTGNNMTFRGHRLLQLPEGFEPPPSAKTTGLYIDLTTIIHNNNGVIPYAKWIDDAICLRDAFRIDTYITNPNVILDERYTFKNLEDGSRTFYAEYGGSLNELPPNLSLKNLKNGNSMLKGARINKFQTVDNMDYLEDASYMFSGCTNLRDLYPDYDSFSLKSLKTAPRMFSNLYGNLTNGTSSPALNGKSVIKLIDALPTWTDGKSNHKIDLSIHSDQKYNPAVNLALKKLDMNYITPIEEMGGTLSENITEDKGWTLGIIYQNTNAMRSLDDEYIWPSFWDEVDLTTELPNGYKRCKYIVSDANQFMFINTNYQPTQSTGLYVIAKENKTHGEWWSFMGCGVDGNSKDILWAPFICTAAWFSGRYGTNYVSESSIGYEGRSYVAKSNWLNSRKWELSVPELTKTGDLTGTLTPSANPIYIFRTMPTFQTYISRFKSGRVYRAKISEGEEIVMDFVPCLNPDGKPCMYDVINGVEYHNQGTGADFEYELYQE